jgi:hypothetical protein
MTFRAVAVNSCLVVATLTFALGCSRAIQPVSPVSPASKAVATDGPAAHAAVAQTGLDADEALAMRDIAVGDWSVPVDGLKGRLILTKHRLEIVDGRETIEMIAYLALHNISPNGNAREFFFDPALNCELRNSQGAVVRGAPMTGGRGRPESTWVNLPFDSTIRLRLSPFGYLNDHGLMLLLCSHTWLIDPDDDSNYFLSGVFMADRTTDTGRENLWRGVLKLPRVKISMNEVTAQSR